MKYTKLLLFLCWVASAEAQDNVHKAWTQLLSAYVDDQGLVNYAMWKENPKPLRTYLLNLRQNTHSSTSSTQEQLAYWINLYNAYTVDLILQYYPIRSIKDIQFQGAETPWDIRFIKLPSGIMSLNEVEHGLLRKKFQEPRIHFALVCAARSCPSLRREAYTATRLNVQLDDQARRFLKDSSKNRFTKTEAQISELFQWFADDFSSLGPPYAYLGKYLGRKLPKNLQISYMKYDWSLNEQK